MADGVTRLGTDELVTGQTGQTSGLCTLCLFWPSLPSPQRRLLSFELRDPLTAWDSCSAYVRLCMYGYSTCRLVS